MVTDRIDLDPFASASAMLTALDRRQISAVELLRLHLDRIRQFNPRLNAIVALDEERVMAAAREADAARSRGDGGPLLGLPMTIKDAINVAGYPTTAGLPRRRDAIPEQDALVVRRLREAGAIIMGKTNVPEYVGDWQTDNRLFGRTLNPWDAERTPGGSTGGGAAAVSAGLSPLEIGSDIGGSIRIPAAFCGIFGHRPSASAVPRSGHFPGFPWPNPLLSLNVIGPLARSAADLTMILEIVSGADVGEDVAWGLKMPPPRHERLADYRIAVLPPISWLPVEDEIMAAQETLVIRLQNSVVSMEIAQPETLGDLRAHQRLYESLLGAEFNLSAGIDTGRRKRNAAALGEGGDEFVRAYAEGLVAGPDELIAYHRERERFRAGFRTFFQEWDVLLAPVTITNAFPHDMRPVDERLLTLNGQVAPYERLKVHPGLAALSGQPGTAFPCGVARSGLPMGLQAIGPYLEDRTAIHVAGLLSQEFGGYQRPPGFS